MPGLRGDAVHPGPHGGVAGEVEAALVGVVGVGEEGDVRHRVASADKEVVTLAAQATTDFEFPDSRKFALGDRYLKVGTEVMRVGLPSSVDTEMEIAGHVTPAIQLPDMDTPIIMGASIMIRAVDRIVKGIEPTL